MAMEIPTLEEYFDSVVELKDARLRDQCTMECEFCDCTKSKNFQVNRCQMNWIFQMRIWIIVTTNF
jgi:hypothetical protein